MRSVSRETKSKAIAFSIPRLLLTSICRSAIAGCCLLAACTATSRGLQKSPPINDANLIARTENLICRGEAVFPFDKEVLTLTLSFEKPDADGARGIAACSKGRDGIFAQCRLTKGKMWLACLAEAGPTAVPMMLRFSSDMSALTGWFGSPYGSSADIQFKTECDDAGHK